MLNLTSIAKQILAFSILLMFLSSPAAVLAQAKQTTDKPTSDKTVKGKPDSNQEKKAGNLKSDGPKADGPKADSPKADDAKGWKPLIDKATLKGWKVTNYGGEGEATVTDSVLMIEQGVDLSGVTTTRKDLPTDHYEVEFEARRTQGNDFFIGFTFPVRDSSCTLICGGWGGGICGISSIDMMDASENETTSYSAFNNGQWYKVKLKVAGDQIEAWLDGKSLLEVDLDDRKVDTRFEMDLSKPMGFASYQSTAEIRKARYRKLKAAKTKSEKR